MHSEDLVIELRKLRDAVERMTLQASAREAPPVSEVRGPVPVSDPDARQAVGEGSLRDVLDRLDELLVAVKQVKSDLNGAGGSFGPYEALDVQEIQSRGVDWQEVSRIRGLPQEQRDLMHFGWSFPRVVQRYGVPTRGPHPSGNGFAVEYETAEGGGLRFWFLDGVLVGTTTH
jgi:hypothetical protein